MYFADCIGGLSLVVRFILSFRRPKTFDIDLISSFLPFSHLRASPSFLSFIYFVFLLVYLRMQHLRTLFVAVSHHLHKGDCSFRVIDCVDGGDTRASTS